MFRPPQLVIHPHLSLDYWAMTVGGHLLHPRRRPLHVPQSKPIRARLKGKEGRWQTCSFFCLHGHPKLTKLGIG